MCGVRHIWGFRAHVCGVGHIFVAGVRVCDQMYVCRVRAKVLKLSAFGLAGLHGWKNSEVQRRDLGF